MGTEAPNFVRWTSKITKACVFTILPDGCRDVVIHASDTGTQVTLTNLDMQPRQITLAPSDQITGFRLRPGLHLDADDLANIKSSADATAVIEHVQSTKSDLSDAIGTLGTSPTSPQHVAKQLGVSLRTLQRHLHSLDLPPPEFWRLLGRARRAAIALASDTTLTDIAGEHGYSDQSHMTRACQHWFGQTPHQIRRDTALLNDISQPALGTWMGEQSSIR